MAEVIRDVKQMQHRSNIFRKEGKRIGVVPTMGYLHEGHLSLIRIAQKRSDAVITTLFVNPAQFGPNEDLSRYPRNFERDLALATEAGTSILFAPDTADIYPEGYSTYVDVEGITDVLEGKSRPGHFRGVATVVSKLFNITKPHVAVFGQKDAQQVAVIRRMVQDLNFDLDVIIGPIVREDDGLAMSSRNTYLSEAERREAVVLSQALALAEKRIAGGERRCSTVLLAMRELIASSSSGKVDYISCADNRALQELEVMQQGDEVLISMAVRFGSTRLIDNTVIAIR